MSASSSLVTNGSHQPIQPVPVHYPATESTQQSLYIDIDENLQLLSYLPPSSSGSTDARLKTSRSKHNRKHKHKYAPKKHKHRSSRSWKRQFAAYTLQLIGALCLVLAALKAFEPLAGVGFTLVVIGYDGGRSLKKRRKGTEGGGILGEGVSSDAREAEKLMWLGVGILQSVNEIIGDRKQRSSRVVRDEIEG